MIKPYYQEENVEIYCGDCLEIMPQLSEKSTDLVITSPPYDNLRDYKGYSFNFENIAKELFRIIKQGGVAIWVVGDATIDGSETGTSFKQALYFKEVGFNLHDTMIWIKDGGGAIGSNKCYTQNHEYMFVFSKSIPSKINLIKDKPNQSFGIDKSGVGRRRKTGEHKIEIRKPSQEFSKRNNWWYIPPQRGEHPSVFPDKLTQDHILSWSNKGDLVLDPMCGSGTTCKVAKELGRKCIGIEISEQYCEIAVNRIKNAQKEIFL